MKSAVEQLLRLKADHQRVLVAFTEHDSFDGRSATPATRWLAAVTGISLSRISRVVKEMAALGYHRIVKRGRDSSRYVIADALVTVLRDAGLIAKPQPVKSERSVSETQRLDSESQRLANGTGEEGILESLVERGESEGAPVSKKIIHKPPLRAVPRAPTQVSLLLPIGHAERAADDAPSTGAKEIKRQAWLSTMGQYVRDVEPNELERFWTEAMKPAGEARSYLNAIDQRMRSSWWWRQRKQRSSAR